MLKTLDWDSEFFGLRIASIDIGEVDSIAAASHLERALAADDKRHELIYVTTIPVLPSALLQRLGGLPVGERVVYRKTFATTDAPTPQAWEGVAALEGVTCPPELLALAQRSGMWSRFRLDKRLPAGSWQRLYCTWIMRSVQRQLADEVYHWRGEGQIEGMATVKWRPDGSGAIGLIAVDAAHRAKGIGSRLLRRIELEGRQRGAFTLEAVTQAANRGACAFYLRNGFQEVERRYVYHLWQERTSTRNPAIGPGEQPFH